VRAGARRRGLRDELRRIPRRGLAIGIGSVAVQVLVPYAAHMAPEAQRGRVVGNVMSGLLLGIMLARPVASFVAQMSSWPVIFGASALLMIAVAAVLWRLLPPRRPPVSLHYVELLVSMAHLARTLPVLRRRALYHACMFGAFSLFWTTTPLLLAARRSGCRRARSRCSRSRASPARSRRRSRAASPTADGFARRRQSRCCAPPSRSR
jgi:MFS family permease